MVNQKSNNSDLLDFNSKIIEIEADALAHFRGLDSKRVRAIFFRMNEIGWHEPKFPYKTALDKVFAYLEPTQALEAFEKEDLHILKERIPLVDYLYYDETPLYSLNELANMTKDFLSHSERNKDFIIKLKFLK